MWRLLAFSKKPADHEAAFAAFACYYNWCWQKQARQESVDRRHDRWDARSELCRAIRGSIVYSPKGNGVAGKDILDMIGIGAVCGVFMFGIVGAISLFRMVWHRKPGVRLLIPNGSENPFTSIFRAENLTDKGLRARRGVFIGFFGFMGCWVVGFAIAAFTGRIN